MCRNIEIPCLPKSKNKRTKTNKNKHNKTKNKRNPEIEDIMASIASMRMGKLFCNINKNHVLCISKVLTELIHF